MRLDHLLSKEHLQRSVPRVCGCSGVVRSTPVAQTIVLRRVLTGGISANSGRMVLSLPSTDALPFLRGCVLERRGREVRGLVFGTLLGPETTGPWPVRSFLWGRGCGVWDFLFLVSRLQRACTEWSLWGLGVWGVWYGVVV